MPLSKIQLTESTGRRNILINGNFSVDQRKAGGVHSGNGDYNIDMWKTEDSGNIDNLLMNITQHADVPNGYDGYCLKYQCKTVESAVAADEFYSLVQKVESRNLQHLGFGTAAAKSITVSFWVKSSLTGVFGFSIYQDDGDKIVSAPYTINTANTWEKKILTFAGNTSDSPANDITQGWKVQWGLWVGDNYNTTATSTWTTYSAARRWGGHVQNGLATVDESTWQIAFVQVEANDVATEYEHRTYADTLRDCQRYYQHIGGHSDAYTRVCGGLVASTSRAYHVVRHTTSMRQAPSMTVTVSEWRVSGATTKTPTAIAATRGDPDQTFIITDWSGSGFTPGESCELYANNSAAYVMKLSAELL